MRIVRCLLSISHLINGPYEGPAVANSGIDVRVFPPHHVLLAQDANSKLR